MESEHQPAGTRGRDGYEWTVTDPGVRGQASRWLGLAVFSLLGSGVYSLLLVAARTPGLQDLVPHESFFRTALVVHVNLTVLIWLLSFAGVFWSLHARFRGQGLQRAGFVLAALGTGVVMLSPFLGADEPLMNNYVPVLRHPIFYTGLSLFAIGVTLSLASAFLQPLALKHSVSGETVLRVAAVSAAAVTGLAMLAFLASWAGVSSSLEGQVYFEFLFWGSGHVVQFTHTVLMLAAWLLLAHASGVRIVLTPRLALVLTLIVSLPVITVPFFYLAHEVASPGHRLAFTELMKYGGLSCVPLGLAILWSVARAPEPTGAGRALRAALLASISLFALGGVLGFLIMGLDIVIPAHYHGSTVAVTLAFMGMTYWLLPRLGYAEPMPRLSLWQPYVYGIGQLLHVVGLAWTGGYGVGRKTAGSAQGIDQLGETIGMGLMGLGGLISVIGGVLFLVVTLEAMFGRRAR